MLDRKRIGPFAALALSAVLVGCGERRQADSAESAVSDDDGKLSVYVVNYPLQYFAERIGGDRVQVTLPAPADVDPAYWSPDAATVAFWNQVRTGRSVYFELYLVDREGTKTQPLA